MFELEDPTFDKKKLIVTSSIATAGVMILLFVLFTAYNSFQNSSSFVDLSDQDPKNMPDGIFAAENAREIYVDLSGAVNKPGVYKLKEGSRISDLLAMGEGIASQASLDWMNKNLNLAAKLEDAQKLYIPFEWELQEDNIASVSVDLVNDFTSIQTTSTSDFGDVSTSQNESSDSTFQKVNLNLADQIELESLPGIGKVYAQKIILNRPYDNLTELATKGVLTDGLIKKLEPLVIF